MMDYALLLPAGIGVGLIMTAAIGPVNFLAINRSLRFGFLAGFLTGCGSALADSFLGAVALLGLQAAHQFMAAYLEILQMLGSVILIVFGAFIFFHKMSTQQERASKKQLAAGFVAGFFLTLTNPGNFFGFLTIFTVLSSFVSLEPNMLRAVMLLLSILMGSLLWWFAQTVLVLRLGEKATAQLLQKINQLMGIIIVGAGVLMLLRALHLFTAV